MRFILTAIGFICLESLAWGVDISPIALPPVKSTVFSISSSSLFWYMNGQAPPNYNNQIVLTAAGPTSGTFVWTPVSNPSVVQKITQENGQLAIGSLGPSQVPDDVGIALNYNNLDVGVFHLTVYAPDFAEFLSLQHVPVIPFGVETGFESRATFQFFDQFDHQLPASIELNEKFRDITPAPGYTDNSWMGQLVEIGTTTRSQTPSFFTDLYSVYGLANTPVPLAPGQGPQPPDEIFNFVQTYSAGSMTPGTGRPIHTQLVRFFRDHAEPIQPP